MPTTGRYGPKELDADTPNSARLYDCFLGGTHNTTGDRAVAARIAEMAPHWVVGARLNRAFLRHAVEYLVDQGVDQFLDLGSGIPTVGNVHEIAQRANPRARVVYVDYEPIAYQAARRMLAGNPNATILHADLRDPAAVLDAPQTRELLDFDRPIGLLIVGVLLFLPPEDRPGEIVATYRQRLVPGSYLAISVASDDCPDPEIAAEVDRVVSAYRAVGEQLTLRGRDEIIAWFDGTDLVEPGLVPHPDWRPDAPLSPMQQACRFGYAGVGVVR
jgi:SAM-dependent methyltransferase